MNISGVSGTSGNWPVAAGPRQTGFPTTSASTSLGAPRDQLEISRAAQLLMELSNLDPQASETERTELIQRIREEIAQGTYDTDEKLELALRKFLGQHNEENY